ncbi:MAG: hypothetical protein ACLPY1_19815 [Terracidiphilus sp.]
MRVQMHRMLDDPLFSQSRRYPRLFRRIVEDSLAGNFDTLKERVLGIELFERSTDYDTNADAIVRVTAAELRKRIAQYYHDRAHESELRIDIPVGGYVAEFSPHPIEQEQRADVAGKDVAVENPEQQEVSETGNIVRRKSRRGALLLTAGIALVLILGIALRFWYGSRDEVDEFWRPFTDNGARPLLCVGQLPVTIMPQGPQDSLARAMLGQKPVSISDAVVVSEYATYLGTKKIRPSIQVSTATNYTDLRQHPVLFIGGLDNNWTLRFLSGQRYRMHSEPNSSILQIYDSISPSGPTWKMDFAQTSEHVAEDYAIVSRFHDPTTESTVVIAAGLGENGTAAAADFLLHSQYLKEIDQQSPAPWKNKNMELVIKTQIIDGNAGPPVIVARYFW